MTKVQYGYLIFEFKQKCTSVCFYYMDGINQKEFAEHCSMSSILPVHSTTARGFFLSANNNLAKVSDYDL